MSLEKDLSARAGRPLFPSGLYNTQTSPSLHIHTKKKQTTTTIKIERYQVKNITVYEGTTEMRGTYIPNYRKKFNGHNKNMKNGKNE